MSAPSQQLGVEAIVSETAGMRQQRAQCDWVFVLSFDGLAVIIEGLDDLEVFELGDVGVDWIVECELALLHQLQGADRGHQLRAGGDPHYAAGLQWLGFLGFQGCVTEGLGVAKGACT